MFWLSSFALAGPDTWLVSVDDPAAPPDFAAAGAEAARCFRSSRVCAVDGADPAALAALPHVRRVERDAPMALAASAGACGPAAPTVDCPDPYELAQIGADEAWGSVCGLDAPVVAIEDSGFRTTHQDLAARIALGWDYGDGDADPEVVPASAVPEHGTFIAGVVAANADDAGRTGVAPQASLFLQKIADETGALYFSYAIAAMDDLATDHPEVGVLNYSIAALDAPRAFEDAVVALGAADIVVVAAASNCPTPGCNNADNDQHPVFPASYPDDHVLAVASLRPDGSLDPYSHYGVQSVDVAAPGADLCSLGVRSDDEVVVASGTSFAAPVAAGAAALVREAWPRLTAAETVDVVARGCAPDAALAARIRCGGALSAARALEVPVVAFAGATASPVAPRADVILTGDSRAAGGSLFVVVGHGPELVVDHPSAVPLAVGDPVPLPGGTVDAEAPGTWLVLDLPADGPVDARIPLIGVEAGPAQVEVRAIPFAGELVGAEATFVVDVDVALAPPETDTPGESTDAEPVDTAQAAGPDGDAPAGEGCGCASTGGGSGALAALAVGFTFRRRVSRPRRVPAA